MSLNPRPEVLVFDVNETLSDTAALSDRLSAVGAAPASAARFLPSVLRDGFARTLRDDPLPFAEIAGDVLRSELSGHADRALDEDVEFVLGAFEEFGVHPDVPDGVRRLRENGFVTVAFTNGSRATCESLLERTGIREQFTHVLSVEDVGYWKPHEAAYGHVLDVCSVDARDVLFVAVHPWDLDGAAATGMRTAWIDRAGSAYPRRSTPPTLTVRGVDDLAAAVV
ncbi:haloacid dehalogenase type II [Kineococcus sp. SYSU DK003]|uniref:haloacid dehalogenase type II n=1 Tax=Kineococcus sp. SYSU DK003 TaxID=3383124 RepID=UPI003D7EA188